MTVTIDTKTLNVEGGSIIETTKVVGTFIDRWESETYKKAAKIFGTVRSWVLGCYETDVAWSNSAAKYLQDRAKIGDKVSFSMNEGNLHQVSNTYVYILGVDLSYRKGSKASKFTRNFTVQLQEAP